MTRKNSRVASTEKIATLLRIYRAAVRSGDDDLRKAAFDELKSKYGVDLALVDPVDLANMTPPVASDVPEIGGDQ